ncbi:SRPBCC family protein [Cypionkella sp.]|uniref:SRPBCC family protein n=1 Tax=Cypionkella sp. TaxID=2811411 RepID=UPI002AB7FAE8|nr:SRPBCC family protein [Cypionkella sp.]MDZ4393569.1 SRPBCC family protein [Cypionkella sp.]
MRFATKQDIEAPIADVFQILTDFETWERAAMRRGAEVARTDKLRSTAAGMRWSARFSYRSKPRSMELELTQIEVPTLLRFAAIAPSVEGVASVELMELGGKRTRLHLVLDVTPRSLTARLFLQSLRLARARIDRKFDQRTAQLAGEIEARYRAVKKY